MNRAIQLISVAFSALLLCSCTSHVGNKAGISVADEAEIRSLMQRSMESWSRGDLTGHLCVFRDDPATDFGLIRPPVSVSSGQFVLPSFYGLWHNSFLTDIEDAITNVRNRKNEPAIIDGIHFIPQHRECIVFVGI